MKLHFLKAIYFPADKVERFNNPYLFDEDLQEKHEVDSHQTKLIFLGHFFSFDCNRDIICFAKVFSDKEKKSFQSRWCPTFSFICQLIFETFYSMREAELKSSFSTTPLSLLLDMYNSLTNW